MPLRTRAIAVPLLLTLAGSVAAGGCQVLAGLTVLEVTTGATSSGGTGGGGGQGGAGGGACAPCANGQSCNDGGGCESGYCAKSNGAASGTCAATKKQGLQCTVDDECGTGHCTDGVCCDVVSCGDECQSCAAPTGTCKPKTGAICGAACGDGEVTTGTCDDAGQCAGQASKPCISNFGCDPATKACNSMCTSNAECSSSGFCVTPMKMCSGCGVYPPPGSACTAGMGGCETCDSNGNDACVKTCDTPGECVITKTLDASKGPARLVCNDQCNGIAVNCLGPFPCEVDCDTNGCFGLTLNCGKDGPCKLICTGAGCPDAKMKCGSNECVATCPAGTNAVVTQTCADSCGCAKVNCL